MNLATKKLRRNEFLKMALGALLLASAALLALVAAQATQRFDDEVLHSVLGLRMPLWNATFWGATQLGSYWVAVIVTSVGAALLYRMKGWRTSIAYVSLVAVGSCLSELIKVAVARPRPALLLDLSSEGYSYPSSHTMAAMCCYVGLAWLVSRESKDDLTKLAVYSAAFTAVGFVGFSRLYLGWHYPTDVLGSILMGLCLILVSDVIIDSYIERK